MNILFLTDGISPYITGGMQNHSLIMVKLLLSKGVKTTLVHCGYNNQSEFNEDSLLLFSDKEQKHLKVKFIPLLNKGKFPGHYIYENIVYSNNIFDHYKDQLSEFDFIYAQGFTGWAFKNKSITPKLLVNFHGFEMFQKAANPKVKLEHLLLRPFVKSLCKSADYVYSFGGQINNILKDLNISKDNILDQSNGIESKWINKDFNTNSPIKIIFIGRNERRKGIEELTQALDIVLKKTLKFTFTFIGPIPESIQISHKNIKYLGEIKNQDRIHQELKKADVLICPSYAEGMPTVILEGMANGLAIIATDVGASSKMINGNGILIEKPEVELISNSIINIINLPKEELENLKETSLKLVKEQFVWERIIEKKLSDLDLLKI